MIYFACGAVIFLCWLGYAIHTHDPEDEKAYLNG